VKKNLVITQQNAFYKKGTASQEQLWNCEEIFQNVSLIYFGFLERKSPLCNNWKKNVCVSKPACYQTPAVLTTKITLLCGRGGGGFLLLKICLHYKFN
jgi:hypothetical protein